MFFLRLGGGLGHLAGANDELSPEVSAQLVAMFWRPAGCRVCVSHSAPSFRRPQMRLRCSGILNLIGSLPNSKQILSRKGSYEKVKEGLYVSLNQSQPESLDYAFCLSSGGRMYFFFRKAG